MPVGISKWRRNALVGKVDDASPKVLERRDAKTCVPVAYLEYDSFLGERAQTPRYNAFFLLFLSGGKGTCPIYFGPLSSSQSKNRLSGDERLISFVSCQRSKVPRKRKLAPLLRHDCHD